MDHGGEVRGCRMQFTAIFYCKIAIFAPLPRNFRACGALFWGAARRGRLRRTPPSIEHPRQPLHLVDTPGPYMY